MVALKLSVVMKADLLAGLLPFTIEDVERESRGRPLGCYCPIGQPCHADLLLRIANVYT